MTPAIDVHTHMLNRDWLELLRAHGRPRYELRTSLDAPEGIFLDGAPFMTPQPGHFDYPYRIRQMDAAGVDLAIISLTCPNVYWGGPEVSAKAAQIVNDDMAAAQSGVSVAHPLALLLAVGVRGRRRVRARAGLRPGRGRRHGAGQHRRPDAHRSAVRARLGGDRPSGAAGPGASDRAARDPGDGAARVQSDRQHRLHVRHEPGDRPDHVRRLPRPLSRTEADRLARRRRAPVPRRPARPVLRQDERGPDEDVDAARRVHAAALLRLGHLPAGGPRDVHRRRRGGPRPLRLRLSPQHRGHEGLPGPGRRAAGRRSGTPSGEGTPSASSVCSAAARAGGRRPWGPA